MSSLRPVDFSTDGVFMAGMAHYPKLLDETMIQAQAAAARAARVLEPGDANCRRAVAVVDDSLVYGLFDLRAHLSIWCTYR